MNKFFAAIAALVVLIAAIIVLAPSLIPASAYKGRLEIAAENALGRDVTIGDELSFKIFPRVAFSVSPLQIANAEGFEGDYLARVERADIGVKLFPLFSDEVVIDRFILTRPDINLQKSADGEVNWDIANAKEEPSDTETRQLKDIRLGDVRIVEGKAVYSDAASGQTFLAENMNTTIRLESLNEPLEIDGSMLFQGAPAKIDLVLTNLAKLQRQEEANLKVDLEIDDAVAGADLSIAGGETFSYAGPVSLNAPDLPALAKLFDVQLADAPGFDNLSAEGTAKGSVSDLQLSGANITFDKIDANGDLALNWSGAKPKATGALTVGTLDLRPYMPPPTTASDGFPAWSKDKFDFSSLRNMDADISLTADKVFLNELEAGATRMQLTVNNGRMIADIPQLGLYGGGGSGRLIVNASQSIPSFSGVFDFSSVQAQPFSMDLLKIDRLLGVGGFKLDFTASGASQAAIMESIDGSGGFNLNDGALKGVNIAKMARAVAGLQEDGFNPSAVTAAIAAARAPDEQTDFSKFLSQFSITDGVVNAPTINLEGPFLTMTGAGTVNLPAQGVDLRLSPRAMTTVDGEGGRTIAIPLRISGTFSNPKIGVDIESIVRGQAESAVRDLVGSALGGSRDDEGQDNEGEQENQTTGRQLLEGILGGDRNQPDDGGGTGDDANGQTESQSDPGAAIAAEAINQIFGRKKTGDTEPAEDDAENTPE